MDSKQWILKDFDKNIFDAIQKEFDFPDFIASVLAARVTNIDDLRDILNPSLDTLYNPFMLNDMEKAVGRILLALDKNEKILIYGDYDVDGVTSTSMLYNFFRHIGAEPIYFIPDRFDDGYGLTMDSSEKAIALNPNVIITVDCGIASIEEIRHIQSLGIDVIITDHHECREVLPPAFAVINPHRSDNTYPFQALAGAGVAYKLITALCHALKLDIQNDFLDLAALGTVADVMPLIGENRIIVKHGLEKIRQNPCLGIKTMLDCCQTDLKSISTYTLGFVLGPRINSAGRLGDPTRGVRLFTSDSYSDALAIANDLNEENKVRQATEQAILEVAIQKIESEIDLANTRVIVVAGDNWHHGVIGIVASRLVEKFCRPTFVLCIDGECARGSGRSITEFNMFEGLMSCSYLFERFGGHEMAAGLTLKTEVIDDFRLMINEFAEQVLSFEQMMPKILVDAKIWPTDITLENIQALDILQPFGNKNPSPVFSLYNLIIEDIRAVGGNKHLKLTLQSAKVRLSCIAFNKGHLSEELAVGQVIDVVCALEINEWNNLSSPQLKVIDIRECETFHIERQNFNKLKQVLFDTTTDLTDNLSSIRTGIEVFDTPLHISRADVETLYRYMKNKKNAALKKIHIVKMLDEINEFHGTTWNSTKLEILLNILSELNLAIIAGEKCYLSIIINENPTKACLESSRFYNFFQS